MLTKEELKVKDFMVNKFFPTLTSLFQEKNPSEFKKWGGNCCRQTAVFGSYFLNKKLKDYKWEVWEGNFNHKFQDRTANYEHAWILGIHKKSGKKLFVDLSRLNYSQIFNEVKVNEYPKTEEFKDIIPTRKYELDWKKMIREEREYYTTLTGEEFIKELDMRIDKE